MRQSSCKSSLFLKECVQHTKINNTYETNGDILDDGVNNKDYLGFITIRPIPEPDIMLSFVYPNFENYSFFNNCILLKYEKKVHLCGKEFSIKTFPHFSQDGTAAVCANADLIMMSKYLQNKYNYNQIRLLDLNGNNNWIFPNDGLSINDISNLAVHNKLPIRFLDVRPDSNDLIKTYVLSGLPVLIFSKDHIVTIVGMTNQYNNYEFVVYDDSGAFFSYKKYDDSKDVTFSVVSEKDNPIHFVNIVSWEKISQWLDEDYNGIIVPLFERVILLYDSVKEISREILFSLDNRIVKNNDDFKEFSKGFKQEIRIFDASKFKNFINNKIDYLEDAHSKKEFEDFINDYSEHYVWVSYGYINGGFVLILMNPTVFKKSVYYFPYVLLIKEELYNEINDFEVE